MTQVSWKEHFGGWLAFEGITDFNMALMEQVRHEATMAIDVSFDDVEEWIRDRGHLGRVAGGSLSCDGLTSGPATVLGGSFQILVPANGEYSDALHLRMRYDLDLRLDGSGELATLHGFKLVENDPGFDAWSDTTTLFTRIFRGAGVPEDADESLLLAIGVLHIDLGSFARQMLSFTGKGGSLADRAKAIARYQAYFAGRVVRAYVGAPVTQTRPAFPIDRPRPDWQVPKADLQWHPVPSNPTLEVRVVPFDVEDLDFPLNVQQLRLASTPAGGDGAGNGEPVLLIPGSGVRANMFYGHPATVSLAEYLLREGYDVWAENWRASIDFPPNSYTLDSAARFDHPGAVDVVLKETGQKRLGAVVHCQGSVGFLMACAAGYLDGTKLSHVVSSAVSLFVEVKPMTWLKQRVAAPIVGLAAPWMDAQWGLRADTPTGTLFGAVAKRMERPCGNPACQLANFMYGSGWDTLLLHEGPDGSPWLHPAVHDWSARELGATPMSFIDQICDASRYGHVVPAQPREAEWPANYLAPPQRMLRPAQRPRYTFIAGDQNRMFRWQGQRTASEFMRDVHECPSQFVGLPGFGHLDTIWGRKAPDVVFPVIAAGLQWKGSAPSPHALETAPGGPRELDERWARRNGRVATAARGVFARG